MELSILLSIAAIYMALVGLGFIFEQQLINTRRKEASYGGHTFQPA